MGAERWGQHAGDIFVGHVVASLLAVVCAGGGLTHIPIAEYSRHVARASTTSDVFNAVADMHRREILDALITGEKAVGALVNALSMSQPQVSKHLRVLSEVGLVTCRAEGCHRLYRLEPARLRPLHDWVAKYEQCIRHQASSRRRDLQDVASILTPARPPRSAPTGCLADRSLGLRQRQPGTLTRSDFSTDKKVGGLTGPRRIRGEVPTRRATALKFPQVSGPSESHDVPHSGGGIVCLSPAHSAVTASGATRSSMCRISCSR